MKKCTQKVALAVLMLAFSGVAKSEAKSGEGGLTSKEIQAVIRKHLGDVRGCYEALLKKDPEAGGTLVSAFVVGKAGKITSNVFPDEHNGKKTMGDEEMRGCVGKKMQDWQFPKPRGGEDVQVSYPFMLNPL